MTIKQVFVIISIFLLFSSCEKKQTDLEFEQSVAYEIFPALMDELHYDTRLGPPSPPKPIYDANENLIGYDRIMAEKTMAEWQMKLAEFKADSVRLVIAVEDSTRLLEKEEREELLKYFSDKNLILDTSNQSKNYKIKLNRLKAEPKLKFKYLSELPAGSEIWSEEYDFHLSGTTGLSRILFDTTKSYGILHSGFACGKLCGTGFRIFIKKVNGKWIIEKMIVIEIA
ncbi:hypothetical protein SAMN05421636_11432 [Pricia antarctica]|uniref:Lipoprotein n=1 Tax=Pricia antarctica TaxID=641691 RepID=A0A1G7IV24_9FLAO|nr:hypothetical protein SAMN05421636_11432 [Pricia antarctica]